MKTIRIGGGAGYSGDRIEPAVELAESGELDYLVFECLAERTIALAQQEKRRDPRRATTRCSRRACARCWARAGRGASGSSPTWAQPSRRGRPACSRSRARSACAVSRWRQSPATTCSTCFGAGSYALEETGTALAELGERVVSANAYIGATAIVEALARRRRRRRHRPRRRPVSLPGAARPRVRLVAWTTGRDSAAEPSSATCSSAPGRSPAATSRIPASRTWRASLGSAFRSARSTRTARRHHEGRGLRRHGHAGHLQGAAALRDPRPEPLPHARRRSPTSRRSSVTEIGPRPRERPGGEGTPRPDTLKVSVGYRDGYIGEGQISYAGPGALARARLALEIVAERLRLTGVRCRETRFDLIGLDSLHGEGSARRASEPYEVRAASGRRARTSSTRPSASGTRSSRSTRTARPAAAARRSRFAKSWRWPPRSCPGSGRDVGPAAGGPGLKLRELAHSRTGDKGTTLNISVIAYRAEDFALLERARDGRAGERALSRDRRRRGAALRAAAPRGAELRPAPGSARRRRRARWRSTPTAKRSAPRS